MSWTDSRDIINILFKETLLPFHEQLKSRGEALIPLGPDSSLNSFYISRTKTRMDREDFEVAAYEDAAGFAVAMHCLWDIPSPLDLSGIVGQHAETARALAEEAEEQTEEVSPLTYVMF